MSHMLPHLPQNTSTRSLSPTSPAFRPSSPSLSCPTSVHSGLDLKPCETHGGYTKSVSPTSYEPQITQSDNLEARRIELDRNLGTDLQPRRLELDRNLGTDLQPRRLKLDQNIGTVPFQIPERIVGDDCQKSYHGRYGGNWKLSTCPTSNPGYTPITIQLKALQTRILKMENLEKKLESPLYVYGRGENYGSSQKPTAAGKPEATTMQKRGASASRTADHSGRESLKSNSSQEPRASGKPDAVFSSRSDEPGNQFESSMFKYADLSNMGRSLLEGDKDQLLSQPRSELMKQEHQVGSFNRCLNELQQQAYAQGLELQDA